MNFDKYSAEILSPNARGMDKLVQHQDKKKKFAPNSKERYSKFPDNFSTQWHFGVSRKTSDKVYNVDKITCIEFYHGDMREVTSP